MYLSACIEWQFSDTHPDFADRIRAARDAGFSAVEFHLWRDKPIDAIAEALAETGVKVSAFCVDPRRSLVDPAQHEEFLQAVSESLVTAKRLDHAPMIIASGFTREGVSAEEHFKQAVAVLKRAAALAEAAGVVLLLEPLNDRVEHPGMYLVSNPLGLDIVEAVGSPALRLLFDVYHSATMGETLSDVLAGRIHRVGHIQVADVPGRHEPGTAGIDWAATIATLKSLGYYGALGLEYRQTMPTAQSLDMARKTLGL